MNKNRLLYIILLFLSFIFIYFYGGNMPYTIFYLALMLPIISFIYTFIIYLRFKLDQELDKKTVTKDDKVHYTVTISNEDFLLYPYIRLNFRGSETIFADQLETQSFSLMPFSTKTFTLDLECKYRGIYSVGIASVEIEDFLGIFKLTYKNFEPKNITVLPRIFRLNRFNIKTNLISESTSILKGIYKDPSFVSDVRNYSYGDPYKSIHWKLTAKMNNIMVKNFESSLMTNAYIFLDTGKIMASLKERVVIEDKVIESLISVLHFCLYNWVHVNLVFFDNKIVELEGKNPLDFNKMFNMLSLMEFNSPVGIGDIVKMYLSGGIARSNILIFTSNLDYELIDEILNAKNSNYEVTLVYISPSRVTGEDISEVENIVSFLPEKGIDFYKINVGDHINQILER